MDVAAICSDLIRIRTENPPGSTADAIGYIRDLLAGSGIRSEVTECEGGRCNLTTGPVPAGLLLCGHVDVVPACNDGWSVPPFSGMIRQHSVWGRGATDMKGGCAAIISAFCGYVDRYGEPPAQLAFVCDEETGGECGIRHLLSREMIRPCDCLIAEPTPVRHPNIGQKGLVRLVLRFSGSPAHGSLYPAVGRSAIVEALALIRYMETLNRRTYTYDQEMDAILRRSSRVLAREFGLVQAQEVLTSIMYNPGVITGGEKSNIVAQSCDLDLEMRIPWGCNVAEMLKDLADNASSATVLSQTTHEPSLTPPESRIVTTTCRAVKQIHGGDATPIVQWAASDARHLRAAGFRVAEYGPGNLRTLHAIDERVTIGSLEKAAEVYLAVMRSYALQDPVQVHS